jgi:nucleoside-diphosphate-sugar epimerase
MKSSGYRTVLVTGASGFIGGHLAATLVERGYSVRALYRSSPMPEKLARLADAGAEIMQVDLTRPEVVRGTVQGIDAVLHVAGKAGYWGPLAVYRAQNYDATVDLLTQARNAGCRKFVYTSSISVHGFGPHVETTEEGPYYRLISAYQITKKAAEEYVIGQNGEGIATTVIRPGNVLGPGDTTVSFPFLKAMQGGLTPYVSGGRSLTCPVYVADLVEAFILAMESDRADGVVFNITGGERVTWREYVDEAAELLGLRIRHLSPPGALALALAAVLEAVYHLSAIKNAPPVARYLVSQAMHDYHFAIRRAESVLGFEPTVNWKEALRRTVEDYQRLC